MPTYEYRCPAGHEFEKFQRMSDPPVAECPECGAEAERMLSAGAGLLFKGDGFYITDYRSDSYRKAAEKEKKGSASGSEGSGSQGSGSQGSGTQGSGTQGSGSGASGSLDSSGSSGSSDSGAGSKKGSAE